MKRLTLLACLVAVFALPGASLLHADPARAARSAQAAPRCMNVQLMVQPHGSQGAAGTIVVSYRIHNLTGNPCTLTGYPGAELLDRHFVTLPTAVQRGGDDITATPVRTIRLANHGNAYFALSYSDVPVGNRPCQAPARYLMVWPPNDFLPVVGYASGHGGSIYSCTGDLHVSPVTAQPTF